jgi:hypothetical protein
MAHVWVPFNAINNRQSVQAVKMDGNSKMDYVMIALEIAYRLTSKVYV